MHKLLEPYAALVPFLGVALGDNVEIALHDLTSPQQEVVAIANGEISGREVGAKLSNLSVHYLETKQFHFGKTEIKNGELKEFKLECDKCKRQITLGVD